MDSEETSKQSICKDDGCRRQRGAGDRNYIIIFSPSWPLCPADVLLSLWPNGDAPSKPQALAKVACWPKPDQELLKQSHTNLQAASGQICCIFKVKFNTRIFQITYVFGWESSLSNTCPSWNSLVKPKTAVIAMMALDIILLKKLYILLTFSHREIGLQCKRLLKPSLRHRFKTRLK